MTSILLSSVDNAFFTPFIVMPLSLSKYLITIYILGLHGPPEGNLYFEIEPSCGNASFKKARTYLAKTGRIR